MEVDFSNDKILLKEFRKGNEQALNFIMHHHHKPLCFYAYSLSNDQDGAKDIVQNIMINIWEKRKMLPDIKNFKNYLYKSVYNEFLNQMRTTGRMMIFEKEFFEAINELVFNEEESLTHQKIELLQSEIEKLSPRCKETFLLSKKEGLTYIEIADYLEISTKTVENNMIKAFSILRKKMKEKFNTLILLLFTDRNKISKKSCFNL
ncbi:MAG: sigma-70 family RNA polymerase sigma factor [Flavobacteriaceae bacterium]|jgi:RNA polymerase sigma-70 factor (ECF subfamily)|nr:sigma-70 family RNA polymerase sigma factor [Flavobacteriaceae bacterium]MBT6128430.1 sigma-70 family RNA polymerase sigma factor [Flavobacteriaceae bacterium]